MASSLPPVTREQAFLETFFQCVSQFAYDKAKEISEKERDTHKASFGSSWGLMVNSLVHFAMAEKMYMQMMFLGQKWFSSKNNLRSSYTVLLTELRKIEDHGTNTGRLPTSEKIIAHMCGQLCQYLTARAKMMDFYEQMTTMVSTNRAVVYEDLINVITEIIEAHQKSFHHPVLSPLKTSFSLECDIIHHLLQAQIEMSKLHFLPSLLQLQEAHMKLGSLGTGLQNKESKKLGFSSSKQPAVPPLYHWLVKYKGALVSKFSLYFNETLSKQAPPGEMKTITAKTADYFGKIVTFQKKVDALNISIVFDTNGMEEPYKGPGYHHPDKEVEQPKGMDTYPAIFSYPGERPAAHWPQVLMLTTAKATELSQEKIVHLYDKQVQSTYFLCRVEPRLTLVVIFENAKKAEKDSYVCNFMTDLCTQLRCIKHFALLKPGGK